MKKWIIYFLLTGLILPVSFLSSESYRVSSDHPVYKLIKMHEKEMDSFLQNANYSSEAKGFFRDTSFFYGNSEKRFLTQVAYMMDHNGNSNMKMDMRYTRMASINGKQYNVKYRYQSNGENAVLIRYAVNQGKPMKAVYRFDLKKRNLEVYDYLEGKKKYQKLYEI